MLKEFFGVGGYLREAEGFLSWQHLTFVSALMVCMIVLAVVLAGRSRKRGPQSCSRVLMTAALLMDAVEIAKILIRCQISGDWMAWLEELPLYLCSIQLITLPLAAFARGRIREAAVDFVALFGLLGAVMGTYCAGNNYSCYPVLSYTNVFSGVTHSIAGFAALFVVLTGMARMHRRNIPITCAILLGFGAAALAANLLLDTNYMFLMAGDGTPYDILYNLVSGNPVLYPIGVMGLFFLYIALVYGGCSLVRKHRKGSKDHDCAC